MLSLRRVPHARLGRRPPVGRRVPGEGIGIGQYVYLHDDISYPAPAATTGFCHPPGGDTRWLTSLGPQVPGSYS